MNTQRTTSSSDPVALSSWRMKGMGMLRIAFGLVGRAWCRRKDDVGTSLL